MSKITKLLLLPLIICVKIFNLFLRNLNLILSISATGMIIGYIYSIKTLEIISFSIFLMVVIMKARTDFSVYRQAMNIVNAKHTFDQLNEEDKKAVTNVTYSIFKRNGYEHIAIERKIKEMSDLQRYGIYALAMDELKINPIADKQSWLFVINPMIIPKKIHKHLETQIKLFQKKFKTNLNIKSK